MSKGKSFRTNPSAPYRRSVHDLKHTRVFPADFGQLYPIYISEMIPGDTFRLSGEAVVRFMPLVAPIMHEINVYAHYFFVPYRLLDENFETFITGGPDGDDESEPPILNLTHYDNWTKGSLLDFLYGFVPPGIIRPSYDINAWPLLAYNLIYNDYYRDENLIDEIDILESYKIQNRAWTKDYFTSALPFQQRGVSPAMPVELTSASLSSEPMPGIGLPLDSYAFRSQPLSDRRLIIYPQNDELTVNVVEQRLATYGNIDGGVVNPMFTLINNSALQTIAQYLKLDATVLSNWDINDLRTAWQTQKFLEAMARVGVRYTEYLQGIWGRKMLDQRLQRPEYIGGYKTPVIISEVLQTSESGSTKQGNMAGHGITATITKVGNYTADEWGICMGILSVMPRPAYQQGLNRRWRAMTRYDYPTPYFMHLSEQQILTSEIYANFNDDDDIPFGWQGIWDEYRIMHDTVHGLIRDDLDHWTLTRQFGNRPGLNKSFIECDAITGGELNPLKRIFAVPSQPGMVITAGTLNPAIRPIPFVAEPGLVDH